MTKVSIICTAFNHAPYITDALDGFLRQKTDFDYEALVHDDASTDGTAEIIAEYAQKHPGIIIPILQKENQFSKHVNIFGEFIFPLMKGEYIALCEGDDYWIDDHKLQKQVDYLDANPQCAAVTAAAKTINYRGLRLHSINQPFKSNGILRNEDIILRLGHTIPTASIVFRTKFAYNMPHFVTIAPVGDYVQLVHLCLLGTIYYFSDFMSIYRIGVPGSWTERTKSIEARIQYEEQLIKTLEEIDKYTDCQYHGTIVRKVDTIKCMHLIIHGNIHEAMNDYPGIYNKLGMEIRLKAQFRIKMPLVYRLMKHTSEKMIQLRRNTYNNMHKHPLH